MGGEGLLQQRHLLGAGFGQIEEVVDQMQQTLGRGVDQAHVAPLLGVQWGRQGELGEAHDAVQRRAELMADVREQHLLSARLVREGPHVELPHQAGQDHQGVDGEVQQHQHGGGVGGDVRGQADGDDHHQCGCADQ